MAIMDAAKTRGRDKPVETDNLESRFEFGGEVSPTDSGDMETEGFLFAKTDPLYERIRKAFLWRNDWRTLGGISRSTGLSEREISGFINAHPHLFVRSPIRIWGKTLFGLKHKTGQ